MAATARPESYTFQDFNNILKQQIVFFDAAQGETRRYNFYSALHSAVVSAKRLCDLLDAQISHYEKAKDRSGIAKELRTFQERYNYIVVVCGLAGTVVGQFNEMKKSLDNISPIPAASESIRGEGDIDFVIYNITVLSNSLFSTGFFNCLTDRLKRFEGLQVSEKV